MPAQADAFGLLTLGCMGPLLPTAALRRFFDLPLHVIEGITQRDVHVFVLHAIDAQLLA